MLNSGLALFASFANAAGAATDLKCSPTLEAAQTKFDAAMQRLIGTATAVVRHASPEDVVFCLMHFEDLEKSAIHVRAEVLEDVNDHHRVTYAAVPAGLIRRQYRPA
jgi:hypothetical protein